MTQFARSSCLAARWPCAPRRCSCRSRRSRDRRDLAHLVLVELRLPRLLLGLGYGAVLGLTRRRAAGPVRQPPRFARHHRREQRRRARRGDRFDLPRPSPPRLAMGASGAAGAALALLLLFAVAGRRPDAATLLLAGLAISLATGRADQPGAGARPLTFRLLRSVRLADGQPRRPQPRPGCSRAGPGRPCLRLPASPGGCARPACAGRGCRGVDGGRARAAAAARSFSLSAVAVGACVAVCGAVGFVGLIAPVIARRLTRGHPGRALLPAALIGATDPRRCRSPYSTGAAWPDHPAGSRHRQPRHAHLPVGAASHARKAGVMTPLLEAEVAATAAPAADAASASRAGQRIALIGPNGSGKTTLLRALWRGSTAIRSPSALTASRLPPSAPARRAHLLSFLPASRDVRWPIPVRDVIALGLARPDPARVDHLLARLRLTDLAERPIDRLSTGERARALLGRALASRPRLLLLDEPLSNLDPAWVFGPSTCSTRWRADGRRDGAGASRPFANCSASTGCGCSIRAG